MATSSIPAAIDYLVATVAALPACADPVVVSDGWPTQRADVGVTIGITPDDDATNDEPFHAELGAQAQWELYTIPCIAWAYVGGTSMKAARDAVFAVVDAIDTLLRTTTGRTLGGALHSGTAILTNVRIEQTGEAAEAGEGRACKVFFGIACKSRSAA
jgi:hypothetical protein